MVIGTRLLTLRSSTGDTEVPVRIFAPEQDDRCWKCRIEIDWPEEQEANTAFGHDSFQALVLGLQMIGALIYTSDEHKSGNLFLEAPGRGYGFPVPANMRNVLKGDDTKFY